jgi:pyruvate,water dikinase
MQQIYAFETAGKPELAQVGGKGLSLIVMTQREMPVPPGFVLSLDFFAPWLDAVRQTAQWVRVVQAVDSAPETLKASCDAIKVLCADLTLDAEREEALTKAVENLGGALFAVRSSSPEEDLEGASFAGGYETVLGVKRDGILDAVRRAFASCFDERVVVYKREHGFDVTQPRIAVVVQQQIASEIAGVAFSLNPINNDYDEVVINANFGLGESVVSGQVSPDTFVVDKVKRAILEQKAGKKETAIWLDENGGTYEKPASVRTRLCLTDTQVLQITDLATQVEHVYGKPMDIEWAFADGQLYLLQARPITTYFPLPEPLRTAPGESRTLYWDMTLTKWGMAEPLSVMGTDYIAIANTIMLATSMGVSGPDVLASTRPTLDGRTYVNASNSFKMQGKKRVAAEFRTMDTSAAAIIDNLNEKAYLPDKLPSALRGITLKVIGSMLGPMFSGLKALRRPEEYERRYLDAVDALRADLAAQTGVGITLRQFAENTLNRMIEDLDVFIPVIFAAEMARMRIRGMFKKDSPEIRDRVAGLDRALPHNVTIEMGLDMVRLAHFPEIRACASEETFLEGLQAGTFSTEFVQAWEQFVTQYGMRCPMEMDPATPRPSEQPAQLFKQLRILALHPEQNPQALYDRSLAEREAAYADLLALASERGKARQFEKNYRTLVALAGFRETPKYCMILAVDMFRRRALALGQSLVAAGRLDAPRQVFDLHIDEVERALSDPSMDLRALTEENTSYLRRYAHSREFPRIIDSRGRILRAPRKATQDGELVGEAISPGTVQGPVKVLHAPDEKPVLPGDILVTRATDPGWTPLFINAAGVVLEVGGLLQHGALVAREYGKPCVAGIEDVTTLLRDGQIVELDGANGVVRVV